MKTEPTGFIPACPFLPSVLKGTESERSDLHLHSVFSDGTHTPTELAVMAAEKGLFAVSLTDHASVSGVTELTAAAARFGMYVIPGVEINGSRGDFLGYFIDETSQSLQTFLSQVNDCRRERIHRITAAVMRLGYAVSETELNRFAAPAVPSRTHLALLLVAKGMFPSVNAVFETLLGRDRPAYIPAVAPPDAACIEAIQKAGGLAVLAHPQYMPSMTPESIRAYGRFLSDLGVAGFEIVPQEWPNPVIREAWNRLAVDAGLLPVGGSNFHGKDISAAEMGAVTIGGDRLCQLHQRLPDQSRFTDFFKRMNWRMANLSHTEFQRSLKPKPISLDNLFCRHLLSFQPPSSSENDFGPPIPFILAGPGVFDQAEKIRYVLKRLNIPILQEQPQQNYPEIAWYLYNMHLLPQDQMEKELLRFSLDHVLYGEKAKNCRIFFIAPPAGMGLRSIKQEIRTALGFMMFYRITWRHLSDEHFTSHIHMPDTGSISEEYARLMAVTGHYSGEGVPPGTLL